MLIPAILRKDEIIHKFQEYYYTEDMFLYTGCLASGLPTIADAPDDSTFQYAIVSTNNTLIGYLGYQINWYTRVAHRFGCFSFDRDNAIKNRLLVGKAMRCEIEKLIGEWKLRRITWNAIGGNPAVHGYDRLCKKYNGNKYIFPEHTRDYAGNYRDVYTYLICCDSE